MIASVASRAPSTPPLTGQSRNSTCFVASCSAARRAVSALTVEQSMTSVPGRATVAICATISSTSASADTHMTIASTSLASAATEAACVQPSSAASALALPALRFHSDASCPDLWRLRAMGSPIEPRPITPARICCPADDPGWGGGYFSPADAPQDSSRIFFASSRASPSSASVR